MVVLRGPNGPTHANGAPRMSARLNLVAERIQHLGRAQGRDAFSAIAGPEDTITLCGVGAEPLELSTIMPPLGPRERLTTRALRSKGHVLQLETTPRPPPSPYAQAKLLGWSLLTILLVCLFLYIDWRDFLRVWK